MTVILKGFVTRRAFFKIVLLTHKDMMIVINAIHSIDVSLINKGEGVVLSCKL